MCSMSKPVRLPDYLHAEIELLAKKERRSLANMVQVLLEQALKSDPGIEREPELSERGRTNAELGSREPVAGTRTPAPRSESPDDHFKPDPKK